MGSYRIEFKGSAERDIRRISPVLIRPILAKIEALADDPVPRQALKLSGAEKMYRMRVGTYRVIYEIDPGKEAVVIHYIRHRREAYREL